MYTLTVNNKKFTIPKGSLRFFCYQRAHDLLNSDSMETILTAAEYLDGIIESPIEFLQKLGIKVEG